MAVLALVVGGAILIMVIAALSNARRAGARQADADGSYDYGGDVTWMGDGGDSGGHSGGDCGGSDAGGCDGGGGDGGGH
jgi:hypothetical protein